MKNSGLNWVGYIPDNWKVMSNKYIFEISKQIVDNPDNFQLLSLTTNGVKEKSFEDIAGKVPENYNGYQVVKKGDFILCLFDLDCSAVFSGLSEFNGMISPAYKILKINPKIADKLYYKYWFSYIFTERFYKQYSKSLRYTVNSDEFSLLKAIVPPLDVQKKIGLFLNEKFIFLNDSIEKLNKQISILEKTKKTLIIDTINHGLKNSKLVNTNIDYLGMIPEHWKAIKGKYIFDLVTKPINPDDGVITCFRDGEVTLRSKRREEGFTISEKEIGYQGIDVGDLIVHGMDGFAGAIGISDSRGKASPVLNVLSTNQNKKFYMYVLRSMAYKGVFIALSTGIRIRTCDTNWGKLRTLFYPLPNIDEQKEIAEYLDSKINELNFVIKTKKTQIETLEKTKKSLLFEYVTGKKEVPNE